MTDALARHDIVVRPASAPLAPVHDFHDDLGAVDAIAAVPLLLDIICRTTGMGFAAVARVTAERWVCLGVQDNIGFGLRPGGELPVESTLCQEIWQSREAIVIDHVATDALYCLHHTPAAYGFQSYISIPIILSDGSFYGTLCAIDPAPNELNTPNVLGMFRAFADLISSHLDAGGRLAKAEASLLDARSTAELHDQFVAALGHDLRNPIAAIGAGVGLLKRAPQDARSRMILDGIGKSADRMAVLVDNVIDLTRGQLGSGMVLHRSCASPEPAVRHAIDELRIANPGREIDAQLDIDEPIDADADQLARLLSNLLTNALRYGTPDAPVRIAASIGTEFTLAVSNQGPIIRPEIRDRLFAPFTRGDVRADQQGLGLGLYIVSEIARAHGGTIEVCSDAGETCFTFRMPLP
jgi:signal transduction histidine kinase